MQDIKNDYDEENLSYLGLNLKRAWKVTRLRVTTTWLKLKARVWSNPRFHDKMDT
jgi:hypothetical protein